MENDLTTFIKENKLFQNQDDRVIMEDYEKALNFICNKHHWIKEASFLITFSYFYLQSVNDNKKWWGKIERNNPLVFSDSLESRTYLLENNIKVQDISNFNLDLSALEPYFKPLYFNFTYQIE